MTDPRKETEKQAARSGFTLVELIVVIAILGILAGIAYPAYTGYIKRANDAAVVSQLSEVLAAVESARVIARDTTKTEKITIDMSVSGNTAGTPGQLKVYKAGSSPNTYEEDTILNNASFKGALHRLAGDLFKEDGNVDISAFDKLEDTSYRDHYAVWTLESQKWSVGDEIKAAAPAPQEEADGGD